MDCICFYGQTNVFSSFYFIYYPYILKTRIVSGAREVLSSLSRGKPFINSTKTIATEKIIPTHPCPITRNKIAKF